MREIILDAIDKEDKPIHRSVTTWLFIGLVMVFFQVLIGGVTRLTDSGLSITEWAVIQGTLPPLNEAEWNEAFEMYKVAAKKQYESLHGDMTLSEFKFIFFWEYFHRLWARMMGFVFIIPFFFFLFKGWLPRWLLQRLGVVILLASLAATFGWIMVASGLNNDNRTWVSAYKLMTHLGIAASLFAYLYWTWLKAYQPIVEKSVDMSKTISKGLERFSWSIVLLIFVQILLGGLMAGMRAGLVHPYFPIFVEGERFLNVLNNDAVLLDSIIDYETAVSIKAWVQIFHRGTAYFLSLMIILFFSRINKLGKEYGNLKFASKVLLAFLGLQFLLGVLTIINCVGEIPIGYAATHQVMALLLLISGLYVCYQFRKSIISA